jgi:hypothetical protein
MTLGISVYSDEYRDSDEWVARRRRRLTAVLARDADLKVTEETKV